MRAGQAVVQMARGQRDKREYALKFFVSRAAFDAEAALYAQGRSSATGGLAQFLPQVSETAGCTLH